MGLLQGQEAGVSPQPADLSTAAVFMLRLVPQLSLPVVLPVFLFPNSSSSPPPSTTTPLLSLPIFFPFFLFFAAVPFSLNMIHASAHATRFPRPELAPTLGNMSCWTDWPAPNVIHSSGATPENSSEAAAAPFPDLLLLCRAQT